MAELEETVEFFGKDFKVSEVTNPHLKRMLTNKSRPGYKDWSKYSCHSDWSQYSDHREKYHEYSAYADQY